MYKYFGAKVFRSLSKEIHKNFLLSTFANKGIVNGEILKSFIKLFF